MPIVFEKEEKDYSMGIWQSTESFRELLEIASLNPTDLEKWNSFQSDKRKREWLTVRVLLKNLLLMKTLPVISYDGYGRPGLNNGMSISISHTKEFIAVIITSKARAGIDLEILRERITMLSAKFTNEEEQKVIPQVNRIEYLHVLWGAKEVLYKIHGQGELDFRSHLHIDPFQFQSKGEITAWIRKKNLCSMHVISYELFLGMMLAYCVTD